MSFYNIQVKTESGVIEPVVLDKVTVEMTESGAPSIMTFSVVVTEKLGIDYGNLVTFRVKDKAFFVGYVFTMKPKDDILELKCYDSLRYLKNKGSYVYENLAYSDVLKRICSDHGMPMGEIEDTGFKIKKRIENDKEYWEMLMTASLLTTNNTGQIYILYDEANKINLKNRNNLRVDTCIVTKDTFQDYDYSGSIDENTYNSIFVKQLDDKNKEIKNFVLNDDENIDKWGLLQYYAFTTEKETAILDKMKEILKLVNKPTRKFKAINVIGDTNVRAGFLVPVYFNLYDLTIGGYMVVAGVKHTFEAGESHFMEMTLYNIDIMPQAKVDGIFENKSAKKNPKNSKGGNSTNAPTEKANDFIDLVTAKEGRPYAWAADGSKSDAYDCSGLVTYGLREMGILGSNQKLTTGTMPNSPLLEKIPVSEAQPGDLVWRRSGNSGHVAVVVGDNKTFEAKSENSGIGYGTIGNKYMAAYRVKEFYS